MDDVQFERLIQEAEDRVACAGYKDADLKDIWLLGVGYLSRNQTRPGPSKKVVTATLTGATAGLTAVIEFVRAFIGV